MLPWQPDHTTTAAGYCTGVGKNVLSHQFNLNSETFANIINQSRTQPMRPPMRNGLVNISWTYYQNVVGTNEIIM